MMKIKNVIMPILLVLLSACNLKTKESNTEYVKLVKTAEVEEMPAVGLRQFPSVVEEVEEVNLAFRVAGPIEAILVKEGDYVEKGQLVAKMDARDYRVQQKAAAAQVEQLRSEYDRIAELKRRGSVSDNDYEKLKAGKKMAEAKLKNTNDQLADTKLYAPFSGYITKVNFEDGELVNHGTAIISMVDVSLLKVEIDVPASFYINRDSITKFECVQEDIGGEVFALSLYGNNIKANNNGLYKLYLYHKPQLGCQLVPGMNVSVRVAFSNRCSEHLSIPAEAIFYKDDKDCVWVLNADSTISKRAIVAGDDVSEGRVNIVNGLTKGARVVVGGLNLLSDGEKVRVVPTKSKTNIGNLL